MWSRYSSVQHAPFEPRAGAAQEEEFELLEEHCFESEVALFDTIHRKHPPLPSPRLADPHAAPLRPRTLANPSFFPPTRKPASLSFSLPYLPPMAQLGALLRERGGSNPPGGPQPQRRRYLGSSNGSGR